MMLIGFECVCCHSLIEQRETYQILTGEASDVDENFFSSLHREALQRSGSKLGENGTTSKAAAAGPQLENGTQNGEKLLAADPGVSNWKGVLR